MRVEWVAPESPAWAEVLSRTRHDFYHLPAYAKLCEKTDDATAGAILIDDGERCLWPLLRRPLPDGECDMTSPYGYPGPLFTTDSPERVAALLRRAMPAALSMLRDLKCVSLFSRTHPLLNAVLTGFEPYTAVIEHGVTVSIDLRLSPERIVADYRKTTRYEIRRAERDGVVSGPDPAFAALPEFVRLYHDTMRRLGASDYYMFSEAYFEGLRRALGTKLSLWVSRLDGKVVAGALFTVVSGIVEYHLSGSDHAYAKHQPSKHLLDGVRRWAQESGCLDFHLGGGLGSRDDSLLFFKAGFSPRRHPFRTLRAIVDEGAYTRLIERSGSEAAARNSPSFFPAYRAR